MEKSLLIIKKKVLEELYEIGYDEKQKFEKELNVEFIQKELAAIKIWKKSFYLVSTILIIATLYLISQAISMFSIELTENEQIVIIAVLILYFLSSLLLVYRLAVIQKKETLIKILSTVEELEDSDH
jgi:hypothetical protein